MEKPFAPSCERNRDPILAVLREYFAACCRVLEIGSGTGQHAVHFAAALPHLTWQSSERGPNLPGLRLWLDDAMLPNTPPPLCLDVSGAWPSRPEQAYDAVFSANTLHIMSWPEVECLFAGLSALMAPAATVVIYGPFSYGGRHTSEGNAAFDAQLHAEAPHRGLRDVEAVDALARAEGLSMIKDREMPANNRCLIWRKHG
jgi:uncharacterized protein DUF938